MNKKGFTLIELLAVIVVLAIIALIATPIILNVIEDAKKSAAIDSAYGYIEAIEFNNSMVGVNEKYKDKGITESDDLSTINSKIKVKGNKATKIYSKKIISGKVVSMKLCIGGYEVEYKNGKATAGLKCGEKIKFEDIKIEVDLDEWTASKIITINGNTEGATLQYKIVSGTIIKTDWTNYNEAITVDWEATKEKPTYIYARFIAGTQKSDETKLEITTIDTSEPELVLGTVTTTTDSIIIPINKNNDPESGISSTTCKYGTSDGKYTLNGVINDNKCTINGTVSGNTYYYQINSTNKTGKSTTITGKNKFCEYKTGKEWTFDYTANEQKFMVPCDATYKLETWGAQGGSYNATYYGGYGGYSTGKIKLKKDKKLFIYVGGSGSFGSGTVAGGYNGGGNGISTGSDNKQGSGGGATHIASISGLLSELEQYKGTYSESTGTYDSEKILIVAGGGGGSNYWYYSSSSNSYSKGGSGGGYIGGSGITTYKIPDGYFVGNASGGSQSIQGNIGVAKSTWSKVLSLSNGGFGFGAFATRNGTNGGGSGFYGGGSGFETGAGGGSGYVGNSSLTEKSMYCYNCTESSLEQTKTIKTTNVSSDPISKYAKKGNGYAKLTLVSFE